MALLVLVGIGERGARVERVELRAGDLLIVGHGGFTSGNAAASFDDAPITIYGGGKLSTVSGELPPILERARRSNSTATVRSTPPACRSARRGKLEATDVPAARRACADAIVGKGYRHGDRRAPRTEDRSRHLAGITLFNGPRKGGNATVLAHAHLDGPGRDHLHRSRS